MINLNLLLFVVVMGIFITELAAGIAFIPWIYWRATTLQSIATVLFLSALIIATGWLAKSLTFW